SESMILPNAAPMITPTARSTTLPLRANFLNSSSMASSVKGLTAPRAAVQLRLIYIIAPPVAAALRRAAARAQNRQAFDAATPVRRRHRARLHRAVVRRGELRRPPARARPRRLDAHADLSALARHLLHLVDVFRVGRVRLAHRLRLPHHLHRPDPAGR